MSITNKEDILFSVLIANYNNGVFIKEAIESILWQTYKNWEIIFVDDASTDESMAIINDIACCDTRIKIFHNEENKGCGYTKNKACKIAHGDILGFLDPDDTLVSDAIQVMVELHKNYPNCGLINSNHYVCNRDLKIERLSYGAGHIPKKESYLTAERGITAFATFKKKIYDLTDGIDISFKRAVDQDLYYKLEEVAPTFYVDKPLYCYRIHDNSISVNKNLYKSRYWFYKAKLNAFNRRRTQNSKMPNISKKELKAWFSLYFFTRANHHLRKHEFCNFTYFLFKGIVHSPIDHLLIAKVKALFLNTIFHRLTSK